jgi:Domain of unknown function (DUF4386)
MSAITAHTPAATHVTPDPMRPRARLAGVLYVITFVSIPTLWLYKPVKDHVDFVLGAGSTSGVMAGALSEVIVGLAGTATAVVLFPVLKRQSESAALGVVTARVIETALIFTGVVSLLTLMTLRNDVAGTAGVDRASLITAGHTQVAVYNSTFLLSQALMPVIVDALLGYLLYRSRLVPRILPIVALIGAPLLLANDIAIFFGAYAKGSALDGLATLPIGAFELAFGIWLIVKGFNTASPLFAQPNTEIRMPALVPAPRIGARELDKQGVDVS